MVEVQTKQEKRVKRKEEVGGLRKERGGKEFRGSGQKDGNSQVERRREKKPVSLVICRAAWQKVQQGQQDQSFKCCLVLAELCVSALCGSTKS